MPRQMSNKIYFVLIPHTPKPLDNIECGNSMDLLTFLNINRGICLCQCISCFVYVFYYHLFLGICTKPVTKHNMERYKNSRHVFSFIHLFCFRHYFIDIVSLHHWYHTTYPQICKWCVYYHNILIKVYLRIPR